MKERFDRDISEVPARGNGSCGPNSLGIIFCSYLLSDQYGDSSNPDKPVISLNEFAHCWNLYYCGNDSSHKDYIGTVDELDVMSPLNKTEEELEAEREEGLRRLNDEIQVKVSEKLEAMASLFGGYRSEHMQQLIAPVLRFAYLLENKLKDDEVQKVIKFSPYQSPFGGFFEYLFGSADADKAEKQHAQQYGLFFANQVKSDMRQRKTVRWFNPLNGEYTTDNSPDYGSFFEDGGTNHASKLLGLETVFLSAERGKEQFSDDQMPCEDGEKQIRVDETKPDKKLFCIVKNMTNVHFDAMLPKFIIEHHAVKKFIEPIANQRASSFLNDKQAYCSGVESTLSGKVEFKLSERLLTGQGTSESNGSIMSKRMGHSHSHSHERSITEGVSKKSLSPIDHPSKDDGRMRRGEAVGRGEGVRRGEGVGIGGRRRRGSGEYDKPAAKSHVAPKKFSGNGYLKVAAVMALLAVGFVFYPLTILGIVGLLAFGFSVKNAYEQVIQKGVEPVLEHDDWSYQERTKASILFEPTHTDNYPITCHKRRGASDEKSTVELSK